MKTMQFAPTRRAFMTGIGAFGLSLGAAGIDLAPQDAFKGKVAGRKLKIASIGCGRSRGRLPDGV